MCTMRHRTKPKETCLINIHAPKENSNEIEKDEVIVEITRIYNKFPGNPIKTALGDANVKIGKKFIFVLTF